MTHTIARFPLQKNFLIAQNYESYNNKIKKTSQRDRALKMYSSIRIFSSELSFSPDHPDIFNALHLLKRSAPFERKEEGIFHDEGSREFLAKSFAASFEADYEIRSTKSVKT